MLDELAAAGVVHRVVFLTADEEALVNRYKETRRRHPLAPHGSVVDGIRAEIELLAPVRERADIVIDTTGLSAAALRRKVVDELLGAGDARAARGDVHVASATSTARRATPTSRSTSASSRTRTTTRTCAR